VKGDGMKWQIELAYGNCHAFLYGKGKYNGKLEILHAFPHVKGDGMKWQIE
jgi:hypothetical protein